MVKFDLKRWLRTGEELITRDGIKVLYAKYFPNNHECCVLISILYDGKTTSSYEDGRYWGSKKDKDDLFFVNDIEPEPKPKKGDTVWVRDFEDTTWLARIFLAKFENAVYPYITVLLSDEKSFLTGETYATSAWKYMRTTDPALDKPKIEITVTIKNAGK